MDSARRGGDAEICHRRILVSSRVRRWQAEFDEGHRSSGCCRVPGCGKRPAFEVRWHRAPVDRASSLTPHFASRIVCRDHGEAYAARFGLRRQLELFRAKGEESHADKD